jgi:hypothetical protein
MATGLPALFCKTVVPVLDSAVLIRPAGTGDSGLRLCGALLDSVPVSGCQDSSCGEQVMKLSLEAIEVTEVSM